MLEQLLRYLNFQWADEQLKSDISMLMEQGKAYLRWIAGCECDYSENGIERQLLFDYTRYALAQAIDEFPHDYENQLLVLAMQYKKNEEDSDEEGDLESGDSG